MLANAIAEMRTYGEGFIIADQSPGLLDMSAIRNTNTKIILRLPDQGDRELVGKAAGLNNDQITELAKLQLGIAAVYQNDWLQPVLCKVEAYTTNKDFQYQKSDSASLKKSKAIGELKQLAMSNGKVEKLKEKIEAVDFADFKMLETDIIARLFRNNEEVFTEARIQAVKQKTKLGGLTVYLLGGLEPSISDFPKDYQWHILKCVIDENCKKLPALRDVPAQWLKFMNEQEAGK
jgi:hypothetical protein